MECPSLHPAPDWKSYKSLFPKVFVCNFCILEAFVSVAFVAVLGNTRHFRL